MAFSARPGMDPSTLLSMLRPVIMQKTRSFRRMLTMTCWSVTAMTRGREAVLFLLLRIVVCMFYDILAWL